MKPRYEIHSLGLPEIVEPVAQGAGGAARPRRARAILRHRDGRSRTGSKPKSAGRAQTKYAEYAATLSGAIRSQVQQLAEKF